MNQEELFDKIKDLIKKMATDYYKYTKELGKNLMIYTKRGVKLS